MELKNQQDGVYLIYKDKTTQLFHGNNPKGGIDRVGIIYDGHAFAVPLQNDLGCRTLLKNIPSSDNGCVSEIEAILDWDFISATNSIKKLGTKIPLKKGQYLPTAPVFAAMYHFRSLLNEALSYASGQVIDFTTYRWFAQRLTAHSAWIFDGKYHMLGIGGVNISLPCGVITTF